MLREFVRLYTVLLGKLNDENIHYIGGSDTLPPPLGTDEEKECIKRLEQGSDIDKSKLIEHNLRLVVYIAKRFENTGVGIEDLVSIGTIGLIKAVSSFDYAKGAKFATYASRCIENEILMQFRAAKKSSGDIYINDPVETDKDGNSLTLLDLIDDGTDIHEQVDILMRSKELYKYLKNSLEPREFDIIVFRYGLYGTSPHTQNETAEKMGISRSYVSRIEKRAVRKLKERFDKDGV